MSVLKCKICGGTLELTGDASVCVCQYCGTKQTLPKLSGEHSSTLYERADHFRRSNDFDKAISVYEQILNENPSDAEAYWSLVLCRYGVEYVEDPKSNKRIATVNRMQYTSVLSDEDYKAALRYAEPEQKAIYEAEAHEIDAIQKGILAISQKEEPFDVFICYKETDNNGRRTQDSVLANELYHQLTNEGFKVFFSRITLEDKLGTAYEPYIFAALNSAKVMVVLGTKPEYFNAVWVRNEWSRYLTLIKNGANKVLIPAYRDMDPYDLPEEFSHLQAQDMSKLGFMQDLIRGIEKLAGVSKSAPAPAAAPVAQAAASGVDPLLRRIFLFLEDGEWDDAKEYCEKVLDQYPECGEAYLGKLMAQLKVRRREDLANQAEPFDTLPLYQKAVRFGDDTLRNELGGYTATIRERGESPKKKSPLIKKLALVIVPVLVLAIVAALILPTLSTPEMETAPTTTAVGGKATTTVITEATSQPTGNATTVITEATSKLTGNSTAKPTSKPSDNTTAKPTSKPTKSTAKPTTAPTRPADISGSSPNDEFTYDQTNGTITITGYIGSKSSVVIPSKIDGMPVVSIGNSAFNRCDSLTSVTIPGSVTSIGDGAFYFCASLTSVTIPSSVKSIGEQAFDGCTSLTSVTIPGSVTSIGDYAFRGCSSLTSVTIPSSVTSIGYCAFDGCHSLTSVTIPGSVKSIGDSAFYGCSSLTSVTIPGSVTIIGDAAFSGCTSLTSVTIPGSVTIIGDRAFYGCNYLTSVTIQNGVKSIGDNAFWNCLSLTSVTIPSSVTSIGNYAFMGCTSLASVTIPSSVTSIGVLAFNSDCSISRK